MSVFDFGKRQRMHTQFVGSTTGREVFQVDEYNQRKKGTGVVITASAMILTLFYFAWNSIPKNIKGYLFIALIGILGYGYYNYQQQRRLREKLY